MDRIKTVIAIHDMQIEEHGRASGVRDMGLIESALAKTEYSAEDFSLWLSVNCKNVILLNS